MRKTNLVQTAKTNIIRYRKEKAMSQTDLAKKMKTSQRLVAYYENKASNIPLNKLHGVADALGVSVGALLDERPVNGGVEPGIDVRLFKRLKQIEALPRRARDALIHSINTELEMHALRSSKTNNSKE
jgi:transcriptional regulator with XRE-family HTH domain